MSKALRRMSESERRAAVKRRLSSGSRGLGYWAAVDDAAYWKKQSEKAAEFIKTLAR